METMSILPFFYNTYLHRRWLARHMLLMAMSMSVEEFNKSHVENAHNVPYVFITEAGRVKNPDFVDQVAAICKTEDHLIVACNSGGRSLRASVDLLDSGFKNIVNMGGGYSAWVDAGFAGNKPGEDLKTSCKFRPNIAKPTAQP
ncbi:Protein HIGH ARSENIC CONTENT 1, mitochondrial [Glycine max]|nr:Protein HIGH ARSENIC CONTENT 1, mitochondrial [Glycine max]